MTGYLVGTAHGAHRVAVMRDEVTGASVTADGLEAAPGVGTVKRGLPAIDADPNNKPLEITIDAERSDADLKLKSK